MNDSGATHSIQLELRLDGTALTGQACVPGDLPRAFSGWVGLVRVVEDLITEPQPIAGPA